MIFNTYETHITILLVHHLATKWRDSSTGQHVEYDQRPDVFRYESCMYDMIFICIYLTFRLLNNSISHLHSGEQFGMLVCMHILAELLVGEMTWNRLLTLLFFFSVVGCLGKDIRFMFFRADGC